MTDVPRCRIVCDDLRQEIIANLLPIGWKVPPESHLMRQDPAVLHLLQPDAGDAQPTSI